MDSDGPKLLGLRSPMIVGDWSISRAGLFPPSSLNGRDIADGVVREAPVSEELACWIPLAYTLIGLLLSLSSNLGFWAAQQLPMITFNQINMKL